MATKTKTNAKPFGGKGAKPFAAKAKPAAAKAKPATKAAAKRK